MELVKESSAVGFLPDLSCSCFFHEKQEYCALVSAEKKLYCVKEQNTRVHKLQRDYQKLIPCCNMATYLAFSNHKKNAECVLYYLGENFREFDLRKLRTDESRIVEDMWLDEKKQLLYVVFPLCVQKYNLNGDKLGYVMKAPYDTWYKSVCTLENRLFLAYEKQGCAYISEYDAEGIYKETLSIGSGFFIGNMEIVTLGRNIRLYLYGRKQGQIAVCLEFSIKNRAETSDITVELISGEGVSETTCYLDCQTHSS